uniref:Uncharacterized protein n=1 Tax=Cavia porcellus TaxID=10141 RepID=A0A286XIW1_CAVPO
MDNCGDGSDQSSWPPASCRGPSLPPSQAGSIDNDSSKPPTLSMVLGSTAERRPPEGQDSARQDASEGPVLQAVVLASSLLLASVGLLVGLFWCWCSSSWATWQLGTRGLCLRCFAGCSICYPCTGRVAPGESGSRGPVFQDQEGCP